MKVFFDTEFIEDGRTIDLISIGMIREDGAQLYRECAECDLTRANDWVKINVLPNLQGVTRARAYIAAEIIEFVGDDPEFWAYYASYDWVALCQLFGTMMDLPKGWPMYVQDLKQLVVRYGNSRLKPNTGNHNALKDAIWLKECYEELTWGGRYAP